MSSGPHIRYVVIALCFAGTTASVCAQKAPKPDAKPDVLRTPAGLTEVGVLAGAPYRIDVPDDWNHSLVVYYHGYSETPGTFRIADRLNSQALPMFQRHYAVIQSAYSERGWALQQAYPETELLRRYFVHAYQQPAETYVAVSYTHLTLPTIYSV